MKLIVLSAVFLLTVLSLQAIDAEAQDKSCQQDSDCQWGFSCDKKDKDNKECRQSLCHQDQDCFEGTHCSNGTCLMDSHAGGEECKVNDDCPRGFHCLSYNGQLQCLRRTACHMDNDCPKIPFIKCHQGYCHWVW